MINIVSQHTSAGITEQDFIVGEIPGMLWSPVTTSPGTPLILMGHGGGLHKRAAGLVARARQTVVRDRFHVATTDAPGHGERVRSTEDRRWVEAMVRAREEASPLGPIIAAFNGSLAERAVPEWRQTIQALSGLPTIGDDAPIGYSGMTLASRIGIALVLVQPRIRVATFGGVSVDPAMIEAVRQITIPIEFVLPWDDPELDRDFGLTLFDAFGSAVKTLHAFPGPHSRVPVDQIDTRFFHRQLTTAPEKTAGRW